MATNTELSKTVSQNLVKFISWNCKGLNGAVKRGNILALLEKLGTEIGFLQETHLKNQHHNRLRCKLVGHIFHSKFNVKSRGTAIIIKRAVPFTASTIISDPQGRYIIVTGNLYNYPVTLANIYAPNVDDEQFIQSFFSK